MHETIWLQICFLTRLSYILWNKRPTIRNSYDIAIKFCSMPCQIEKVILPITLTTKAIVKNLILLHKQELSPFIFSLNFCQVTEQNKYPIKKKNLLSVFWILLGEKSLGSDASGHLVCFFLSLSQSKDSIKKAKALLSALWGIKSPAIHPSLGKILKSKALRSLFLSPSTLFLFLDVVWNKNRNEMLFSLFWSSNQACLL